LGAAAVLLHFTSLQEGLLGTRGLKIVNGFESEKDEANPVVRETLEGHEWSGDGGCPSNRDTGHAPVQQREREREIP